MDINQLKKSYSADSLTTVSDTAKLHIPVRSKSEETVPPLRPIHIREVSEIKKGKKENKRIQSKRELELVRKGIEELQKKISEFESKLSK